MYVSQRNIAKLRHQQKQSKFATFEKSCVSLELFLWLLLNSTKIDLTVNNCIFLFGPTKLFSSLVLNTKTYNPFLFVSVDLRRSRTMFARASPLPSFISLFSCWLLSKPVTLCIQETSSWILSINKNLEIEEWSWYKSDYLTIEWFSLLKGALGKAKNQIWR